MLPFLIVSQLLPIHFIYPSCVCGRGSRRTDVGCGCPAINLYLTDGVTTCFQSLQVEALIFCWGTESARLLFLNGPSTSFSKSDCCILSPWSPPHHLPPSLHPESVQAIPSPTDVPIIMPTGWKTVSKALVQSFGHGGISPCARLV